MNACMGRQMEIMLDEITDNVYKCLRNAAKVCGRIYVRRGAERSMR